MKIKCEKCGKIFESKSIKKRYCDECVRKKKRNTDRNQKLQKYWNDEENREKKKEYRKKQKIFQNYYGLLLGTTDFGSHRKEDFKEEFRLVRKERRKVLTGNTYTNHKYLDLYDSDLPESRSGGVYNPDTPEIIIPDNLNNFKQVEEVQNYIIEHLHINTNKIYGTLKVELPHCDKYILFCKVNGRVTENCIYTPKGLYA